MLSYAAVFTVVATIGVTLISAGFGDQIATSMNSVICGSFGADDCEEDSGDTAAADQDFPVDPDEGGIVPSPPGPSHPVPSPSPSPSPSPDTDRCNGSWPDLQGVDGDEAVRRIQEEHPDFNVSVVPEGSAITMDMRCGRVRVFVDGDGNVTGTPHIG